MNGEIRVLCGGRKVYNPDFTLNEAESTHGMLVQISDSEMETLWTSPKVSDRPYDLTLAGGEVFFLMNGKVYRVGTSGTEVQELRSGNYYTLSAGNNASIYATDPADFASPGFVHELHTVSGEVINQWTAGIIPRQVVVKSE